MLNWLYVKNNIHTNTICYMKLKPETINQKGILEEKIFAPKKREEKKKRF